MDKINWGIIGCGDVTEIKSGPAFNKVPSSALVAVMRRDEEKVKDYARRHQVPKWYTDANNLINDPDVNAIYIATPPSSHEEYTLAALKAGKPVYVEKPMTVDPISARKMAEQARALDGKLVVAHYRRAQPLFNKIKELLDQHVIGDIRHVRLELYKQLLSNDELANPSIGWRVDAKTAGGGLFHDLAPHQLDLLLYYFGEVDKAAGFSLNQAARYEADDAVAGTILFQSGVLFSGTWCFAVSGADQRDKCEIIGEKGSIHFSFFDHQPVKAVSNGKISEWVFDPLQHVQQPMIEKVVNYFLDRESNPCSGHEGVKVMELLDKFTL